jgi:hypothetical protein
MAIVDLQVPYEKRGSAKKRGARWDAERKTWYVPDGVKLEPFAEWVPAAAWLTQHDQPKRRLSMSPAAIRTREKKVAAKAARRSVDSGGRASAAANYTPQEIAMGLPWTSNPAAGEKIPARGGPG